MSFLTPIWLLAIAAISIPLLIHLWNITPGKTLKVGSISLIELSSRKRSRSFKLADILLLLLRCLFIILLAFVLALPFFKTDIDINKEKGWLLISKEDFKEAYQKFKPKTDSLLKAGYELHYFDEGFRKISIADALAEPVNVAESQDSYWYLLEQLAQQKGAELQVYLITSDLLNKFSGDRPSLNLKLNWQTYTPADSINTSIKQAWFTPNKDVRILVTTSTPSQTTQHAENINPSTVNSEYNIEFKDGKALISLKNNEKHRVVIDTPTLNVDVFSAPAVPDADYVKAALQSIGQFNQQNIIVKNYSDAENLTAKRDWLFWLSDKPLSAKAWAQYKNVFVYENGNTAPTKTWINYADNNSLQAGREVIPVFKSITPKNDAEAIWQDGFGCPILTTELKDKTHVYHFYSRFNPSWSDLVWSATFPQFIQKLVYPEGSLLNETVDRRSIDAAEIKPAITKQDNPEAGSTEQHTDITHYFWLLMALTFMLERWLAHKKAGKAAVA